MSIEDRTPKHPAAVELGKRAALKLTREARSAGGRASAAKLSDVERSARARKAALARHGRRERID